MMYNLQRKLTKIPTKIRLDFSPIYLSVRSSPTAAFNCAGAVVALVVELMHWLLISQVVDERW